MKLRYESINLVKAGWIHKHDRVWEITGTGRTALHRHSDDRSGLLEEAYAFYSLWAQSQDGLAETSRLLAAAEHSHQWLALSDLAGHVGIDAAMLGQWLQGTQPPGWHLALDDNGTVSGIVSFVDREGQLRWDQLLHQTLGVLYDPQRIASAWVAADDLARRGNTPEGGPVAKPLPRAWQLHADRTVLRITAGREGRCSLFAPRLANLTRTDDLLRRVDEAYPNLTADSRSSLATALDRFLAWMRDGDLLVTYDGANMSLGRLVGKPEVEQEGSGSAVVWAVDWADGIDQSHLGRLMGPNNDAGPTVHDVSLYLGNLSSLLDENADRDPVDEPDVNELPDATAQVASELTHGDVEWLEDIIELLRERPQLIFQGPPGTGKTFTAMTVARHLAGGRQENVRLVQFHPSYGYEDFVEGYRIRSVPLKSSPSASEPTPGTAIEAKNEAENEESSPLLSEINAGLTYEPYHGPLKDMAVKARKLPRETFVLVIDEINRGDLPRIFGELYFLLEYREEAVQLMHGGAPFRLPPNLVILGTMNTSDRSITAMDTAMRRRFRFVDLHPDKAPVKKLLSAWLRRRNLPQEAAQLLVALNRRLATARLDDPGFRIGPSYLMQPSVHTGRRGLERVWQYEILPLLAEIHWADGIDVESEYGLTTLRDDLARKSAKGSR